MQLWFNRRKPGLFVPAALLAMHFTAQGTTLGSSTYFEEPPPEDRDTLITATNLGIGSFDGVSILHGAAARPISTSVSSAPLLANAPRILGRDRFGLTQRSKAHICHEDAGAVCSTSIGSSKHFEQHD